MEEDYTKIEFSWCTLPDGRYPNWGAKKGDKGAVLGRWTSRNDETVTSSAIPMGADSLFEYGGSEETKMVIPKFKICAPIKDFDMTGKRVEGVNIIADVKDPIVLQPVPGGYLIVSKWGDEAEDKSLVNEIEN